MKPHKAKFVKRVHQYWIANPNASDRKVARVFKIAYSTIRRWRLNEIKYGVFGPYRPGKNRYEIDQYKEHIVALATTTPTITTATIKKDLEQTFDFSAAEATIGKALLRYEFPPPKVRFKLAKLEATNAPQEPVAPPVKTEPIRAYKLSKAKVIALKLFVSFFHGLCVFYRLKDGRKGNAMKYRGEDILLLTLFACLAGQSKFKDIVLYCENNAWFFHQFMDLPTTMFNVDTLKRTLGGLDVKTVRQVLYKGMLKGLTKKLYRAVTLDGKIICGSGSKKKGLPQIGIASVVSHVGKLVLDSVDYEFGKEAEAVRTLLRNQDIEGLWVTADALHCNRETVELILQRLARYCLRLRKNQRTVYYQVEDYVTSRKSHDGTFQQLDTSHGRTTIRTVYCYKIRKRIQAQFDFPGVAMVVVCDSYTLPSETERRVYLFSEVCKPELAALLIRNHWGVESVHWELDVNLREDEQQATDVNAVKVLSVVTRNALNLVKIFHGNDSNRAIMKGNSFNPNNLIPILTGFDANIKKYAKKLKEESKIYKRLEKRK